MVTKQARNAVPLEPNVNDLLAQLLAPTGELEAAAGVAPESLVALRRILAAILIQQNPIFGSCVVLPEPVSPQTMTN